jgi:hypothetical protein
MDFPHVSILHESLPMAARNFQHFPVKIFVHKNGLLDIHIFIYVAVSLHIRVWYLNAVIFKYMLHHY